MENHLLLEHYLKGLRLPSFLSQYQPVALDATRTRLSYERYLLALAEAEVQQRELNRQKALLKAARFPVPKELADFDFSAIPSLNKAQVLQLAEGGYLVGAENILMLGQPGLGKSHVATGLATAACRAGKRVRFYNVAGLVNELVASHEQHQLSRFLSQALRLQLIVLDEFGFVPFSGLGAHLLFQFCSALHERVSLIVTTNLRFSDWTQVLGDEQLTLAFLDRLSYKSHVLEFVGESWRFKKRLEREGREQGAKKTTGEPKLPQPPPAKEPPAVPESLHEASSASTSAEKPAASL